MGKLGKKARKFAKKHLPSVLKKRRQFKSMRDSFKRKNASRGKGDTAEDHLTENSDGGNIEGVIVNGAIVDTSLDTLFSEDDDDSIEDASDSDGFLSEDLNCPYIGESENEDDFEENSDHSALLGQNREIRLELVNHKKKLDRLKQKDPEFSKYLENHRVDRQQFKSEDTYSDEEGKTSDQGDRTLDDALNLHDEKVLTISTIDAWCQLAVEQKNVSVLPNLLNGFRAACHYGTDGSDSVSYWKIHKREAFHKIMMFVLCEADGIFRRILGIANSSCKKETILELRNTSKWKTVKPLVKSYLRSTLYLLNQVTDCQILTFTFSRIRVSIIFFAAFPSLLQRLNKVAVHLWATGGGNVSLSSFFIIREMILQFNSDCLDTCLRRTYKAFIAHSKFVEPTNLNHIQFLRDSVVKLYSLDMQKSYHMALVSVQQLATILQPALKTKKKEALKKIYNWQYTNCIDLWVKFISENIKDHDLLPLLYLIIQIINGVTHLFPGPRYMPLRLKCLQMLNQLSNSSGVFIPVASLVLSSLEYRGSSKADARPVKAFNFSSVLKVPKQLLKSRDFREECVLSAIELLSVHFAQWSYHISFPEVATIPLIRLKKFHEETGIESLRRLLKRLIDQVEQNIEFVQKKRDEVAFSPKDQESVDSFLQLERSGGKAPFSQYYASVLQKSISRSAFMKEKISVLEQKGTAKQWLRICNHGKDKCVDSTKNLAKEPANPTVDRMGESGRRRRKKQRI